MCGLCDVDGKPVECFSCGRKICFDVFEDDGYIAPAHVTDAGDAYCKACADKLPPEPRPVHGRRLHAVLALFVFLVVGCAADWPPAMTPGQRRMHDFLAQYTAARNDDDQLSDFRRAHKGQTVDWEGGTEDSSGTSVRVRCPHDTGLRPGNRVVVSGRIDAVKSHGVELSDALVLPAVSLPEPIGPGKRLD